MKHCFLKGLCLMPVLLFCANAHPNNSLTIQNNCDYGITIRDSNGKGVVYLGAGKSYINNSLPIGNQKFSASAGASCTATSSANDCALGWGEMGTLFEINPQATQTDYDISAVNGFDFPMTVTTSPAGAGGTADCAEIDTGSLDVSSCDNYMLLYDADNGGAPTIKYTVRSKITRGDSPYTPMDTIDTPAGNAITCRSPRTFALNYSFLPNSGSGSIYNKNSGTGKHTPQFFSINMNDITRQTWQCNFANPGRPDCTKWGTQTSYFNWIRKNTGNNVQKKMGIYAYPSDDDNNTVPTGWKVNNTCRNTSTAYTLTIGKVAGGAGGNCPAAP